MPEEEAPQMSRESLIMEQYANRLAKANHQIIELTTDNQLLAAALEAERAKDQ